MARKRAANLTDGEMRLMRVVWERGAVTVQAVADSLPDAGAPLAYNTVLTTMRILERKGYLTREKAGRAHVYSAAISREEARGKVVRHLVETFFDDSPELLLLSLLDGEKVSAAELDRLKRMIAERDGAES